jgi:SAM-dependent methyltransferase
MSKLRLLIFVLILACAVPVFAQEQSQTPAPESPTQAIDTRETSTPYAGDLTIFDSPGRDARLQIDRVMDILGITAGKTVADIGAGSGWFTVRAARRVGIAGSVYAVDINPDAIHYISNRAQKEALRNIRPILSNPDDPRLPVNTIDVVLMLKTYHEVAKPVALLRNLRPALRPGAKIGIIDRSGNGTNHGVARDVVIREATAAGYTLQDPDQKNDKYDFVKGDGMDYFLVFTLKQ